MGVHAFPSTTLDSELRRFPPGIVALVGGGGKTSLLHRLGPELAADGGRVLCTTSTRMARPGPECDLPVRLEDDPAALLPLPPGPLLAARPGPDGSGKVLGYSAAQLDELDQCGAADWLVVEADGAARRPLKVPAPHEPMIPSRARAVVAVVGLSALLVPFSPETVFRFERAAAIAGLREGEALTPDAAAALVAHPNGLFQYAPPGAARLLFLNQADLPGAAAAGAALAHAVAAAAPGFAAGIYMGSLGTEGLACRTFAVSPP